MSSPDDLLNVEEAAEYLRVPVRFIRRIIAEKWAPYHKVGGRYVRFRRSDLDEFVAAGRVEAS